MAAYFLGTSSEEIGGRHAVQARIPMNTSYLGYSDINQQQPPLLQDGNFVFLNHPNFSENEVMPHGPSSHDQHHFLGIPLQAGATAITSPSSASGHELHGFLHPRVNYNLYALPVDLGPPARDVARTPRGLSLSLSSQQPSSGYGWSFRFERDDGLQQAHTQRISARADDDVRVSMGPLSPSSMAARNNVSGVRSVFPSSKYLKVTQELLDEVVNVASWPRCRADPPKAQATSSRDASSPVAMSAQGQGGGKSGAAAELTTPERQEIQMKKAKLVNMLDEVEQRYRQYHHHMQTVISSFEQAAGVGSAKTYTAVALQTISKHFRCLKDAIIRQINAAGKSLGGAENADGKTEGSRLKYVGSQIRQQRALQQLGIIQHNAWRPQRGLPERSVTVLRAWLFEHFLHPYPKDLDKVMLAKQTGLTRSQVSNWFINARVRLWKPMVEEMYMEEMREHEKNGPDDNNKTGKIDHFIQQKKDSRANNPSTSPPEIDAPAAAQQRPKKFGFEAETPACEDEGGFGLIGGPADFIAGFGEYSMSELGRFNGGGGLPYPGNAVSLTLGPPHGENISPHQTFLQPAGRQLAMQVEEAGDFGRLDGRRSTDMYEEAKGFETQLLPDFVA